MSHYRSRPCPYPRRSSPRTRHPRARVNRRIAAPRPVSPPRLHVNVRGHPAAIDTMRARIVKAAEAWDALATHAAKQAGECRHGAELADRTRRRWAHSV